MGHKPHEIGDVAGPQLMLREMPLERHSLVQGEPHHVFLFNGLSVTK